MAQSIGDRLYLIRLALGDGFRRPQPIPEFVAYVRKVTGEKYHDATISLLERMKQKWRVEDVETFALVDPLGRGKGWLAWGEEGEGATPESKPTVIEPTPEEVRDRAREALRESKAKQNRPTKRAKDR